jgi:transposase
MARFDLSDREWSIIGALLPNKPRGWRATPPRFCTHKRIPFLGGS